MFAKLGSVFEISDEKRYDTSGRKNKLKIHDKPD